MQILRCLLELRWPDAKFRQVYVPDRQQPPAQCVAWSRTGLLAFSAPVVEDTYCVYITAAAR
jgi:hypothetical protein